MSDYASAIARIEANTEAIVARLDRLNGTVAKHEQRLGSIEMQHATELGQRKAPGSTWERVLMLVTLIAVLWTAWSTHIQAVSAAVHK